MSQVLLGGSMDERSEGAAPASPVAQAYRKGSHWQRACGERLIDLARVRPGERVMDLGCGTGALTLQLAELVGPAGRVLGLDPDGERIALARQTCRTPNVELRVASAEDLGEGAWDPPYHLIFSNFVFHWLRDKRAILRRMRDLLHPTGRILVQCVAALPEIVAELSRLADPLGEVILRDFFFEEAATLAHHVEGAGLQLIRLEEQQGTHVYPTFDALLTWWQATTHSRFDPRAIAPEALARFAEERGRGGAFFVHESFCWFEARRPEARYPAPA